MSAVDPEDDKICRLCSLWKIKHANKCDYLCSTTSWFYEQVIVYVISLSLMMQLNHSLFLDLPLQNGWTK